MYLLIGSMLLFADSGIYPMASSMSLALIWLGAQTWGCKDLLQSKPTRWYPKANRS